VSSRSSYRDRKQRAIERGFSSPYAQAKMPKRFTGQKSLAQLPAAAKERRREAINVLAVMRREGTTLGETAKPVGIEPHVVEYYAREGLTGSGAGARARPADRLYRPMHAISGGQVVPVDVRGSRVASLVGEYWNTVRAYLDTGDEEALRRFRGMNVGGFELETDPDVLDEMARRGMFEFDSIYRMVA
jgi:hypothetical protein